MAMMIAMLGVFSATPIQTQDPVRDYLSRGAEVLYNAWDVPENRELVRFDFDIDGDGIDDVWLAYWEIRDGKLGMQLWRVYSVTKEGYRDIGEGEFSAVSIAPARMNDGKPAIVSMFPFARWGGSVIATRMSDDAVKDVKLGEYRYSESTGFTNIGFEEDEYEVLPAPEVFTFTPEKEDTDATFTPGIRLYHPLDVYGYVPAPDAKPGAAIELLYPADWSELDCVALVKDGSGNVVKSLVIPISRRIQKFVWDGKDAAGQAMAVDKSFTMTIVLSAKDATGRSVQFERTLDEIPVHSDVGPSVPRAAE